MIKHWIISIAIIAMGVSANIGGLRLRRNLTPTAPTLTSSPDTKTLTTVGTDRETPKGNRLFSKSAKEPHGANSRKADAKAQKQSGSSAGTNASRAGDAKAEKGDAKAEKDESSRAGDAKAEKGDAKAEKDESSRAFDTKAEKGDAKAEKDRSADAKKERSENSAKSEKIRSAGTASNKGSTSTASNKGSSREIDPPFKGMREKKAKAEKVETKTARTINGKAESKKKMSL